MSAVEFLSVESVADLLKPSCHSPLKVTFICKLDAKHKHASFQRKQATKGSFILTKTALKLHLKRHTSLPNLGECRILLDSFDRITCKTPNLFYYVQYTAMVINVMDQADQLSSHIRMFTKNRFLVGELSNFPFSDNC